MAVPADRPRWAEHARLALAAAGHRAGGARGEVVAALARQECCLTAQEIFDGLRAEGRSVGLATVYRALDLLSSLRLVRRMEVGGVTSYEPADPSGEHHHHAICGSCGKVSPFADPALEDAIEALAERLGYAVDEHDVVLRGACPDCAPA